MISAGDFKNGVTVEIEGNIFQIMEFHIQMVNYIISWMSRITSRSR